MRNQFVERLKAASELVSENSIEALVGLIWSSDKLFTTASQHATARHLSAKLREWDVKARTFEIPADGKTVLGDWTMPMGWECNAGLLEVIDPFESRHKVLADRKKRPLSVGLGSGSTPNTGVTAAVIKIHDAAELTAKKTQLKGKFAYLIEDPRQHKKALMDIGVAGVISSWCPDALRLKDATGWLDTWSDDPAASGFHEGDHAVPVVMISSEKGVELDVLMERGTVKLRMAVEAQPTAATFPVECGYIDATLQEEILGVAPLLAPGANDASGAAVMLEVLRVLQSGVKGGQLTPLKRGVRILLAERKHGLIGFGAQNPGIVRRILAGISLDGIGRSQEAANGHYLRIACPDASASVADVLLDILMEEWLPTHLPFAAIAKSRYVPSGNLFNDPEFSAHCPAIKGEDRFKNTSDDTPENHLSARALHAFATITAAYVHILSTSGAKEALWLAQETVSRHAARIAAISAKYAGQLEESADKPALLAKAFDHLTYAREVADAAVMSAKRFMLREERAAGHLTLLKLVRHLRRAVDLEKRRLKEWAGVEAGTLTPPSAPFADIAGLRPFRKFLGTPTYDSLAPEARAGIVSPRTNPLIHAACFWADGKRTFAEIVRRVEFEFEQPAAALIAEHFQFMAANGLMVLLKQGEAIPKPAKPVKHEESAKDEPAPEIASDSTASGEAVSEDEAPLEESADSGDAEPEEEQ